MTHKQVFVFLSDEFRHRLGRVVKFGEDVFLGFRLWDAIIQQLFPQIATEGLCRGQEHTTVAHGVALHIVEIAVGMGFLIVIQTVTAQQLQQRTVFDPLVGDIGQIDTCRIALVFDVKTELCLLHRRGKVVYVLHHQLPVTLHRIVRRVLQRLHEEGALGVGQVGSKLTHLIGHASRRKLIGHSQHLIGLQTRPKRHIAQGLVHGILR